MPMAFLTFTPSIAANLPLAPIKWPTGTEAIIDRAIAIKIDSIGPEFSAGNKDNGHGRAFVKCMNDLSTALGITAGIKDSLLENEGNDLKVKIALWALDREIRPQEYARLEHLHVCDNLLGKAFLDQKVAAAREAALQKAEDLGIPEASLDSKVRRPQPHVIPPRPVDAVDTVEGNRLIFEYLYFAPPSGSCVREGRWFVLGNALCEIRNERSIVMLKFDLESRLQGIFKMDPYYQEQAWKQHGYDVCKILDFRTAKALSVAASFMHHERIDKRVGEFLAGCADDNISHNLSYYLEKKPRYDAFKNLALMEWSTEAEKALAAKIKAIPPFPKLHPGLEKMLRDKTTASDPHLHKK